MVKQGHYAGVSTNKKSRQLKQRAQRQVNAEIDLSEVADFLQGRYVLTQHATSALVDETMQRFLAEWGQQTTTSTVDSNLWDMDKITIQTLARIASKVPWQFYAIIVGQWSKFSHFIIKEVLALPTKNAVRLTNKDVDITSVVSQQLAVNWYLSRFAGTSQLATVTNANIQDLSKSFISHGALDWQNVAVVYSTTPFTVDVDDTQLKQWLQSLVALSPEQL